MSTTVSLNSPKPVGMNFKRAHITAILHHIIIPRKLEPLRKRHWRMNEDCDAGRLRLHYLIASVM